MTTEEQKEVNKELLKIQKRQLRLVKSYKYALEASFVIILIACVLVLLE